MVWEMRWNSVSTQWILYNFSVSEHLYKQIQYKLHKVNYQWEWPVEETGLYQKDESSQTLNIKLEEIYSNLKVGLSIPENPLCVPSGPLESWGSRLYINHTRLV